MLIFSPVHVEQQLLHMSRADPVEVDDMVLLLVPVLAQQPSEVRRADREHKGVCGQELRRKKFNEIRNLSISIV